MLYDIQYTSDQGEQFLIEMQRDARDGFFRRLLYYAMRLGSEQVQAGKQGNHYPLPGICAIAIVNYDPWKDMNLPCERKREYLNVYQLVNSGKDHSYPASFELILVELPRFTKTIAELQTNLDKWLCLMKALPHLQEQPSSFEGPLFEKLFQLTDYNKLKEDQKMTIDYDRDLRSIASASKREGREEGREEGLREGIQQQKHSSVLALIKQTDLDDQKIASIEGVEESFVRKVRAGIMNAL
ncbi:putative transposase/invertase (TIGR01784 family) [Anseongella ginsenosidimutans]|uniref:Putative transposase/invertase (TIGR01784 family) n=1 Tax=Anseongella ginsenosidimutans TaxID=496056 RepID=A0A4R3KMG5_9SPHI|nr:Rpn family recombination-promoting nuclease/putative transposase [Anseongella ginsenosidimutans]TCS85491.1 putative transposase/invertase (TIGR01784 family) [Anseongella ginsenosidimutans]